jgi:exopolyphosphatase / guanosine-5'-triphosphate,3'-diphosphate pyrophosphatase
MRRVAAIDIGSNSVRLVIYGVIGTALMSLYDEKATCGLGRNLSSTGHIDPEGRESALRELRRFAALASDTGIEAIFPFATAAVRDADDGERFVKDITASTGLDVEVLSGLDEARYAALGVAGAIPGATGVMGDLGGGSLELVQLANGEVVRQATLPIGALMRPAGASAAKTEAWLDEQLATVDWLDNTGTANFYLVGGAWRAFARAHMEQENYPLSVIHQYEMPRESVAELANLIGKMSDRSVELLESVPRRRRAIMPYASLALSRIIAHLKPNFVVASAHGLREGFVHYQLAQQGGDPFLDYCRFVGIGSARILPDGDAIHAWVSPLFPEIDPEAGRWLEGACWLADLAGRDHPDRRADIALARGMNVPSVAISHAGRAFLGAALRSRYGGGGQNGAVFVPAMILSPEQLSVAEQVGKVLRLAHAISPNGKNLAQAKLALTSNTLELDGPPGLLAGDTVARRLKAAANAFGRAPLLHTA